MREEGKNCSACPNRQGGTKQEAAFHSSLHPRGEARGATTQKEPEERKDGQMRTRHIIPCHTAKWHRRPWTQRIWMASRGKSQKRSVVKIWKYWNHRTKEFLNWKFCETDREAKGEESDLWSSYITPWHLLLVIVWKGHRACQHNSSYSGHS